MPSPQKPRGERSLGGLILWLPAYNKIKSEERPTKYDGAQLAGAAYNHPVVVLSSKQDQDGVVVVLLMTTFGGKTLQEYAGERSSISHREKLASKHVPIHPSPTHGPHHITLRACGGSDRLARNSYVITQPLVRVKFTVLVEYGNVIGGTWAKRLDTSSHHQLLRHVQFMEPVAGMQAAQRSLGTASSTGTRGVRREEEAITLGPPVAWNPPAKAAVVKAVGRVVPIQQSFEFRVENGSSSNLFNPSRPRQPEAPRHRSGPIHSDRLLISAAARQTPLNFGHHHHYGSIAPQSSERSPAALRPGWVTVDIPYSPAAPLVPARRSTPSTQVERYPTTALLPTYSHTPRSHRPDTQDLCCYVITVVLLAAMLFLGGYVTYLHS